MNIALTHGEIQRLYEEIGDLPKSRVGPKLLELYRRLERVLGLDEKIRKQQQVRGDS